MRYRQIDVKILKFCSLCTFQTSGQSLLHNADPAAIADELGWPIESYKITSPTAEIPGRHISHYFLPNKIVKSIFGDTHYD